MGKITVEQVKHFADVARLEVSEDEADQFANDLTDVLEAAELLNEVDTTDVVTTTHVLDLVNVMRKDEPKEWITHEEAMKNAPDEGNGQFRVPSILSE